VAERLGVRKIDASSEALVVQFVPNPPIDTSRLITLMQRSRTMRLAGPERLRIEEKLPALEARLQRLREVFKALG
jgi:transcription-repair coupling factor (superfamily II helicase)